MKNIIDYLTNMGRYNPHSKEAERQALICALVYGLPFFVLMFFAQKSHADGLRTSHLVAGTAGYVIGKQGNSSTQPTQQPAKQFNMLPVDCRLSDGVCITPSGKNHKPTDICQATYGESYKFNSFVIQGERQIIILCEPTNNKPYWDGKTK